MTEQKWKSSRLVDPMMKLLFTKARFIYKCKVHQHPRGRRRLRLFGVAVARRVVHLAKPSLRKVLEAAEALADGVGCASQLRKLADRYGPGEFNFVSEYPDPAELREFLSEDRACYADQAVALLGEADIESACTLLHPNAALALKGKDMRQEIAYQANLLREIFGNPFRPVAFDADWRTSTAVALAKQMYDSRDFSATPILADALQDVGCENDDVLNHCRDAKGVHVRGCWVVDLVLGKS